MPAPASTAARSVAPADRTASIPMVHRSLEIRAESFSAEARTVEVVFTTGARGTRFNWSRWDYIDEELATDAAAVRLERLNGGAPVLNAHSSHELSDQIGVVVPGSARMADGAGVATIQLSSREDVAPIVQDIADGIIRNVSVGYVVHSYEITENEGRRALYRAVDWEPFEISFVPIPFDAGSQTRSGDPEQGGHPCIFRRTSPAQELAMDEDDIQQAGGAPANETRAGGEQQQPANPPAQQQRQQEPASPPPQQVRTVAVADIRSAVANAGLGESVALDLIERHVETPLTRESLMADIGEHFARRDASAQTNGRVPARGGNGVTMIRAMGDALVHQMAPSAQLSDAGREFRGMGMLRMAEEIFAQSGVNTRGMSRVELVERALHTTSDFSALMGGVLQRRLRMAYEENVPSYRIWARRAPNAPDFRAMEVVQLSAMPDLLKTSEAGEFKYGTMSDGKVSYGLVTYGRIIGLSRQLLINDDLRALERITVGYAASAARLENRTVYAQLTSNPAIGGAPLFHADHKNLASSGAAISAASLGAGRTAMRLQKGQQNEELNLAPSYLIVPATQEQLAYQYTSAQFVPAKSTDINEFRSGGRTSIEPVVEAILDGVSSTAWYMAARNTDVDTVEYSYLDGAEGVQLSSRPGFTVDGMEFKASLDFAAGLIDWIGLYKNPGA